MLVEEQTPKPGARKQYEEGRKQLVAWHASIKDPRPLVVFEQITGENAGTYGVVLARRMRWADLDKPVVPYERLQAQFDQAVGDSVAKVNPKVYEEVLELGYTSGQTDAKGTAIAKYYEITTMHVPLERWDQFYAGLARFREALEKTKTPIDASWFALAEGGSSGTWVLVVAHDDWASFDEQVTKSPPQILKDAFGEAEAHAVLHELAVSMGGFFTTEVVKYRPDLSYFPAK